ncbi:MAG: helix-turn-helix domain-containing protein [Methylovulum sp.]|nr:helix-turn-helix domain-containing protein [Methylovulum sp.]
MKDRIKKLRNDNGLTQTQFGEIIGVGQKGVSGIEKGESKPTTTQIEIISKYFNVSADYLIFGIDDIKPNEREILKAVRDDISIYNAIQRVIASKKHLEGIAA